jgi:UDP:flavonoid glycosyltransferase YjiC (YdhE family)
MKRRFLFVMIEGGGNVPAQLSVARRLAARGHVVHVLTDPAVAPEVEAAGCEFVPLERAPHQNMRDRNRDVVRDFEPKTPFGKLRRVADALMFGPAEAYARDTLCAIERVSPDAVAVDCLPFGAMVGAEKSGLPSAVMFHLIYCAPVPGATPFGFGVQPARGLLGRLRDRLLTGLTKRCVAGGRVPVNAARESLGLAPLDDVFEQYHRLTRELVLTSRDFDFVPPVLPDGVRYVGAQLDDPAWAEAWTSPWPESDTRPLVLVSLGTTEQEQRPAVARTIEALGGLDVRGLVTLGGLATGELPSAPNVRIVPSVPHAAVMPRASAVVCHAGHGTVMKSLAHGLPVVCVPFGRDQHDNAARVVARGAGLKLSPQSRPSALRAGIERALGDRALREGACRLAVSIERDSRADAAVSELEALSRSEA